MVEHCSAFLIIHAGGYEAIWQNGLAISFGLDCRAVVSVIQNQSMHVGEANDRVDTLVDLIEVKFFCKATEEGLLFMRNINEAIEMLCQKRYIRAMPTFLVLLFNYINISGTG